MITKITQNGINGAMFVTISPFLVIDDNTTKASMINCNNMKLKPIETAYACLDAYYHPMMAWPPSKTMISTFVPPPILLLLPHDLIHLACLPLGIYFSFLGTFLPLLEPCLALIHISPPL